MRIGRISLACALTFACAVSIFPSQSLAFDGDRKGFILGFGAGVGYLSPSRSLGGNLPALGLQTDLKIGLGINDRVLLHYTGKQFWMGTEGSIITDAFPLLGVTYYLSPAGRAAFVSGGLGAGLLEAPFNFGSTSGESLGPAGYLGAGYEFARHWQLEFDVVGQGAGSGGVSVLDLALTLNLLGY